MKKQFTFSFIGLCIAISVVACNPNIQTSQNMIIMEQNKEVIKQYVEKFNVGDLDGLRKLFAENAMVHGVLGWGKVDDVMPIWQHLVEGLAIQLKIENIVAEGDMVAVRYLERGTSRAPFFDKPVTYKSYELVAMEWFVVKDGKIHKRWGARDAASQSIQLGWDVPANKKDVDHNNVH